MNVQWKLVYECPVQGGRRCGQTGVYIRSHTSARSTVEGRGQVAHAVSRACAGPGQGTGVASETAPAEDGLSSVQNLEASGGIGGAVHGQGNEGHQGRGA